MAFYDERLRARRNFFLHCPRCLEPASLANVERYWMGAQRLRCDRGRCMSETFAHVWEAGSVRPSSRGFWARIKKAVGQ
jgi:hypothetical protein